MRKVRFFLWVVVFFYLVYAIWIDGPTPFLIGLFGAAVFTAVMQVWLHSNKRSDLRAKYAKKDDTNE